MRVIETIAEMTYERTAWGLNGDIGFVPTMGYLHAGHLSLVRRARDECERVVVSIFVNPAQFAPEEDLSRYPRDRARDLAQLEDVGVDVVFAPAPDTIYPPDFVTYVTPTGPLAERLEAASRPTHFRGVCTVVLKLFHLVAPTRAYFGQKDAQQLAVIRRMVADLDVPISVQALPIVRAADGLAMSSRNVYLDAADRRAATVLYRALKAGSEAATERLGAGPEGIAAVVAVMRRVLVTEPRVACDYADVCNPESFAPLAALRPPALLAVAARVGQTRLIDNLLLRADGRWDMGVRVA